MDKHNIVATSARPLLTNKNNPDLNSLGGWFVLVIIGRFLTIIMGIYTIFNYMSLYPVITAFEVYCGMMIAYSIIWMILLSAVILIYIYKRNIMFRTLFVIQVAVDFVFSIVFLSMLYNILISQGMDTSASASDTTRLFSSFVGAVIWIIYLYRSKRVKNTFIYSHQFPETFDDSSEPDTQV